VKVGDLVKVSNKGFTTTGFIKAVYKDMFLVRYFQTFTGENVHSGLWTKKYITLLRGDK